MKINIVIDKPALKKLVLAHLDETFSPTIASAAKVVIETKSKQNYKSEWEDADYRATITVDTDGEVFI